MNASENDKVDAVSLQGVDAKLIESLESSFVAEDAPIVEQP